MSKSDAEVITKNGLILFWGGWPSNWHPSPFVVDGINYNCVEQWMTSEKARVFGDEEVRAKILASPYPRAQKEFGRKVRGYVEATWVAARFDIVLAGTVQKYEQNQELLGLLLATSDNDIFVEASPFDTVWGIGLAINDPRAWDKKTWRGQNLLGNVLTEARRRLRTQK